ncbi:hypothetical protein [Chromobacterium sp. IIBBL 290-4]|uniref:hypothetical protein n=1 Tax=Chromobacterium sp. IIBBL 290-4 TaxID=2953890 RepID=UPI0020B7EEB1|nr:hypothetical protein [Chromobacterium sp. IIBBL 290-4]UTH74620.1 hypothetical protein NKT35_00440 [Chromobacterium sp. IIBBL 290-4]
MPPVEHASKSKAPWHLALASAPELLFWIALLGLGGAAAGWVFIGAGSLLLLALPLVVFWYSHNSRSAKR